MLRMVFQHRFEAGEKDAWEAKTTALRTPLKYFRLEVKKAQPLMRGVEGRCIPRICHKGVVLLL